MSRYMDAINKVLQAEGGFVNHPNDRGGPTNWGITQRVYDEWVRKTTNNPSYSSTIAEIQNMPVGNAVAIYKANYWDAVAGDRIKFYSIAAMVFDQAVNRGVSAAVKQVQRVLGLSQSGVMDATTLSRLNAADERTFIAQYLAASEAAYRQIVANNPSQSVFLTGWLNRISTLQSYALRHLGTINATTVGIGVGLVAMMGVGGYFLYKYMQTRGVA